MKGKKCKWRKAIANK